MLVVLTTVANDNEAHMFAGLLVKNKLAACVQFIKGITSYYVWNSVPKSDTEILLLIKTNEDKRAEVEEFIKAHSSYELPEIVAISSEYVSPEYQAWMDEWLT